MGWPKHTKDADPFFARSRFHVFRWTHRWSLSGSMGPGPVKHYG